MQSIGLLGYNLLYVQLPFLVTPLPSRDLRENIWTDIQPSIGLYSYTDSLTGRFLSHDFLNRSILGESDFYLLSEYSCKTDTPYSSLRFVNGYYSIMRWMFSRPGDHFDISGGIYGRSISGGIYGFGSVNIPFQSDIISGKLKGFLNGDIYGVSLNTQYFYLETVRDKWIGYLKVGDVRLGLTGDRKFISYLLKPVEPIFLIFLNASFKGELSTEMDSLDYYVAPVYLLSDERSLYGVISRDPAIGFKSEHGTVEIGQEESYLFLDRYPLKTFFKYEYGDGLPSGGFELSVSTPLYYGRIEPELRIGYVRGKYEVALGLRILEADFFWGLNDFSKKRQFWGMNVDFSF